MTSCIIFLQFNLRCGERGSRNKCLHWKSKQINGFTSRFASIIRSYETVCEGEINHRQRETNEANATHNSVTLNTAVAPETSISQALVHWWRLMNFCVSLWLLARVLRFGLKSTPVPVQQFSSFQSAFRGSEHTGCVQRNTGMQSIPAAAHQVRNRTRSIPESLLTCGSFRCDGHPFRVGTHHEGNAVLLPNSVLLMGTDGKGL